MQTPLRIRYHELQPSRAVSDLVERCAQRLERTTGRITGCEVTLEGPGEHHHHGRHYRVRIELSMPGRRLVVGRNPDATWKHEDLYGAVRVAFREARRQLDSDLRRRLRRETKHHVEPERGTIARLFPWEGYGFIRTADGRELYFHEHAVLDGAFRRLTAGARVRFTEEQGDLGPQASTVRVEALPD